MEEAEAEILIPFELHFSDLLLLSSYANSSARVSSSPSSFSRKELERLESISTTVMQTLGPTGPGLLSITGVPKAGGLRRSLLPLARKLALLGNKDRARVFKEHGLGSDVPLKNPDRSVSSFALQLKYEQDQGLELFSSGPSITEEDSGNVEKNPIVDRLQQFHDYEFKQLGKTFKELGRCMMEIGLRLAQICDKAIGGRELEQSIIDSGIAKGRLIHYHSALDNLILKETKKRTKASIKKVGPVTPNHSLSHGSTTSGNKVLPKPGMGALDEQTQSEHLHIENSSIEVRCCRTSFSNLWQQWHYDYGIFTVLTTPLFMSSPSVEDCNCVPNIQELSSPDGHTYLQLYDTNKNKILAVKSSPENFIVQVGEAADILSNGKLRSTLHSVGRPVELENLCRETFVVFLQPAWSKTLSYSGHLLNSETTSPEKLPSSNGTSGSCNKKDSALSSAVVGSKDSHQFMQEILSKIPPLSSRLKDGMTFAEFSRETTKQYYGGSGTQSRR